MKIPVSWLRDFVDIDIPLNELADRLTQNGLETKVEYATEIDSKVIVAQITAVSPHPNADRLRLVTVDTGKGLTTVVCGAPNVNLGDKVAFAQVGSTVRINHQPTELKVSTIRGVESCGMICAEDELGISDNHQGIIVLNTFAPIGEPVLSLIGEAILDVEITPNRADCMSVVGMAYEVAAACDKRVQMANSEYQETNMLTREKLKVRIIDPDVTTFYSAAFLGEIKVEPSPKWMQDRLSIMGVRPVNNIVDVTNYVLMEMGLPMHAFDYDKLQSKSLVVRSIQEEQTFVTLDGKEHLLTVGTGVICDGERPIAIAGIMGGLDTAISAETKNIALEAACFNPASIHRSAHGLKLSTEASTRFERGLSVAIVLSAIKRGIHLIQTLTGAYTTKGVTTDVLSSARSNSLDFDLGFARRFLGLDENVWSNQVLVKALKKFGLEWSNAYDDYSDSYSSSQISNTGLVSVPYHRSDITNHQDLVEEVARGIGYDNIPVGSMASALPNDRHQPSYLAKMKARAVMGACGFWEIITHGLTSIEELKKTKPLVEELKPMPLRVLNPMAGGQEYLRTNMRGALLVAIRENRKHQDGVLKLYELGHVFIPRGEGVMPAEPEMLYAALVGDRSGVAWPAAEKIDFYRVKGVAQALLSAFGIDAQYVNGTDDGLLEGRRADVMVDGKKVGVVGQVHPTVCGNFDINEEVFMLNFSLPALMALGKTRIDYRPVIRFPKSERDLAFIVDKRVASQEVLDLLKDPLVQEVSLFDLYEGRQVGDGKKSLAFRLTLQASDRTLTDGEIDQTIERIVGQVKEKFGAVLRS